MRSNWRQNWPIVAMQAGAFCGTIGMVGGQVAQAASFGQVIFTALLGLVFLGGVWLLAIGASRRVAAKGPARLPEKEPMQLVVVGLMVTAVVMWLTGAYGIFIAVRSPQPQHGWHVAAYLGVAICATGAAAMVRQARQEWVAHYRRHWYTEE